MLRQFIGYSDQGNILLIYFTVLFSDKENNTLKYTYTEYFELKDIVKTSSFLISILLVTHFS
jgi:Na+/H+ antiporter NhaA